MLGSTFKKENRVRSKFESLNFSHNMHKNLCPTH